MRSTAPRSDGSALRIIKPSPLLHGGKDLFPADQPAGRRGRHLRHPEGVPHAHRAPQQVKDKGQRQDDHRVPHQGNDEGRPAHPQPLQGAAGNDRHRRDDKTQADDPQRGAAQGDGLGIGGEQADQLAGNGPAQDGAQHHDARRQRQPGEEDLPHAGGLFGAVVVAHDGPHPLHDAVGGQVEEGLQFVVDPQHQDIYF